MRNKLTILAATALVGAFLTLGGCSKPAETAASEAAKAAEAEVAAAEQKIAEAEKAIADAQAAQEKSAEAQRALDDARRELESARRTAAAARAKTAAAATGAKPEGTSAWSQEGKSTPGAGAARPAAAPPPPREFTLPAGAKVAVRTTTSLSTKNHQAGHRFQATLHEPLEVDGYVIAPRGASVTGEVVESDPGGRVKGVASIAVRLVSVEDAVGESLAISTGAFGKDAPTSKGKDAAKVGIGAGIGAAIGAIAGGGKGAAIGAAAGGAAGTGAAMATRGDPAVIPGETLLTFTLSAPLTVKEKR